MIGLRRDLGEDANVADEHDDQRYEKDDDVDEGEVGLAVADWAQAKDGLADCLVRDHVDTVDAQLWDRHQRGDCPTYRSHRRCLRKINIQQQQLQQQRQNPASNIHQM